MQTVKNSVSKAEALLTLFFMCHYKRIISFYIVYVVRSYLIHEIIEPV